MPLTTEALDAATGRVRFVPTLNAGSGEVMGFHRHLLADGVRTGTFVEAVRRAVRPLDVVVDLGTGTGVLAVAAAQAGAGTVIGIERAAIAAQARALAAANDVQVQVVQGVSDQVSLPRIVDVLVSECLGLAGLGGAMIGAVKRARDRWLKPGGRVIPKRVRALAAPVEDLEAHALVRCWDGARVAGVRLDVLGAHVGHNLYIASFTDRHLLAPPVVVCRTDLQAGPLEQAVSGSATSTTTRPGTMHGWALWFEADLDHDLVLRTGPLDAPTVWQQCFAPVPARWVEAGTPIGLTLGFRGRHAGLDQQPPDAEGVWIDWDTTVAGEVRHGSTEFSHPSSLRKPDGPNGPGARPLPRMVPVTTLLARAMVAARAGWTAPARMGAGATGELFRERMQARIAERLSPQRLARYLEMRDAVRAAVRLSSGGDVDQAGKAFEACAARLPDYADDPELDDLARFWLYQAWAYYDIRRLDPTAATARLRRAMHHDTRLERVHGYDLMHVGRIHTVQLWLRVQAGAGERDTALDGANAILAYVNGFGGDLPVGTGWSLEAAARIPADLAAAMTRRVASEVGTMLAGLDRDASAAALERLPMLERLPTGVHDEVTEWARVKRAWTAGRAADFLDRATRYLAAGRRETCLWHAVLLDLCRAARALRPDAARLFCAEVAARSGKDTALARRLRKHLQALTEDPPALPWVATMAPRRFHLVCVGLPRSGVASLCTLFRNFRTAYDYAEAVTIRTLVNHDRGLLSRNALRAFLVRRDRESALEVDAASFLHLVGDVLAGLSDETRFVLPVRAPDAWFESYLRELLRVYQRLRARGKAAPAWHRDYGQMLVGRFAWEEIATPEARRVHLRDVARRFLTHWTRATAKMLDTLPPERTLVLRTQDLGAMRNRLGAFVDQPGASLTGESHSNAALPGPSPLAALPEGWLARTAAEICGATHARALERCSA